MRIAIVGAGVAGLAAAWALRGSGIEVVVFEKSRGLAGRAATRRRDGARYDHGAQYFRASTGSARQLIRSALPTDDLVEVGGLVLPFDSDGRRGAPDPRSDEGGRWSYSGGINALGKHLAAMAGAELVRECRIVSLDRLRRGWSLVDAVGGRHESFDAVLVTAPGPQAAALVQASALDSEVSRRTVEALGSVAYRSIMALVLAFDERLEVEADLYALVNSDRDHPVSWLALEERKPGHVPAGRSLLVAHMADFWTRPRFRWDLGPLVDEALPHIEALIGLRPLRPQWCDKQGWLYALPEGRIDRSALSAAEDAGLYFAGDSFSGGSLHLAIEDGLTVASRMLERSGRDGMA